MTLRREGSRLSALMRTPVAALLLCAAVPAQSALALDSPARPAGHMVPVALHAYDAGVARAGGEAVHSRQQQTQRTPAAQVAAPVKRGPTGMGGLEMLFAGVWGALFIFLARIVDVSCDTMRVLFTVRGKRTIAGVLGFAQALVWIFAVGTAIKHLDSWMHVVAYAAGYAAGTMSGITIERFVAYGVAQVRVITRSQGLAIASALRDLGFGVTQSIGEGRSGSVDILHSIVQRSQVDDVIQVVDQLDPAALVTVEEPRAVRGGFVDTREWRVPLPWEKSRQRV